jgi:hypothetical protein
VRTADRQITGKFYFEYTCTTFAGINSTVGLANGWWDVSAASGLGNGAVAGTVGIIRAGSLWIDGGSSGVSFGTITSGTVICFAVDIDAKRIWARVGAAGNWNGNVANNPATGVGGIATPNFGVALPVYPAITLGQSGEVVTANFGDTAFTGTVPSGFTSGFTGAPTPPAKDQSNTNTSISGTTTTIAVTSAANSVVVVGAVIGSTSTTTNPTLSIAGAGLTWNAAPPGSGVGNVGFRMATQLFWAYATSALTAQTVTITSSQTIDAASTGYETLTGASSVSPVDPNVLSSFGSFGATITGTITTTNANDTCLVLIGSNYNTGPATAVGTGTRDLNTVASNGLFAYFALGRWTYTSAQSGATVGFTGVGSQGGLSAITLTAGAGASIPTNALATQVALEEWYRTNPQAQVTQIMVEQWAAVSTVNPQVVATQILLEQWASVATISGATPQNRVMVLA